MPMTQNALLNFANSHVIDTIRKAAHANKTVILTYRDSKNEVTTREGEPYEIKDGGVYMYCYLRQSIRFFKLDQIMSAKIGDRSFTPKFPINVD